LGQEESEAYMQQLAEHYVPFDGSLFDSSLDPMFTPGPGVTEEQIAAWEAERGVRLPDVLRQALALQDGGYVRETALRVLALAEIRPPDEEFWLWTDCEEAAVPDRQLIFEFACQEEFDARLFLNYNMQGTEGEPGVLEYHSDPGELRPIAKSVTKFFERILETFDAPSVDWSEAAQLAVIARETLDLTDPLGNRIQTEQILGRRDKTLVLMVHERTDSGEKFTKTTLPEPLSPDMAMIQRFRPGPMATHSLVLQPDQFDGILQLESERTRDGRWKNHTSRGTPICVQFESRDRGRLETLRRTVFGQPAADRAQSREDTQEQLQRQMDTISPEAQHAAAMQMVLQMRGQFGGGVPPQSAAPPPQAAALQAILQQRLQDLERRAKDVLGQHPLSSEIQRLMQKMMEPPADGGE